MLSLFKHLALYLLLVTAIVTSFSPDQSSFDAYGLKLAANDILLVESLPSQYSFLLRLAPFNYSLTCTLGYNSSNQYVYAVALAAQMQANSTIRFVFIGVNTKTNVPFIGLLDYTGISGAAYVATTKTSQKNTFPCDGWSVDNYRIHNFNQFVYGESDVDNNINFYVVAVEFAAYCDRVQRSLLSKCVTDFCETGLCMSVELYSEQSESPSTYRCTNPVADSQ
ncbi:unnamed protein product [Rotaria socialis]